MQHRKRLTVLLDKYTANAITEEEHAELFHLIASGDYDDLLEEHFTLQFYGKEHPGTHMQAELAHIIMQKILIAEKQNALLLQKSTPFRSPLRFSIVAVFTGLVVLSFFVVSRIGSRHSFTTRAAKKLSYRLQAKAARA